ncbi:MAG: type IV toxin-antitoxin system AbiEi family antitoxin domain-containing protein [Rhodoferax sp.]|nr:type IV toxin-antitoxin system AbiEi family antitoxin domain-containing protein [Rhodoferax sp.]
MQPKVTDPALELAHAKGLVRARELAHVGASGEKLQQLLRSGALVRISRGLYATPDRALTELDQLVQLSIKYPHMVFCLLTALQIHGLTTQAPHEVWVAISSKARAPSLIYPPLHIVRFSDPGLGIEQKLIDGVVHIPVTSVAKTVADCFKFRNKIGLDIALEALRDAWRQKKVTMDELWESAQTCRVANVMRPYLESLV